MKKLEANVGSDPKYQGLSYKQVNSVKHISKQLCGKWRERVREGVREGVSD